MMTVYVAELGVYLGGSLLDAWNRDPRVRERWLKTPPHCMGRTPEEAPPPVSHRPGSQAVLVPTAGPVPLVRPAADPIPFDPTVEVQSHSFVPGNPRVRPSDLAVCTLSVGDHGKNLAEMVVPRFREYAGRIGAAFYEFRIDHSPYPMGEKFHARELVARHRRTLFLDVDIVIEPETCVNLFDVVPEGFVGMHDDLPYCQPGSMESWIQPEHDAVCDSQGWPRVRVEQVLNSGVVVLDREHADFFTPPLLPYPKTHCGEQILEYLAIVRRGWKVHPLDVNLNYQWWFKQVMPDDGRIQVRHYAGIRDHRLREDLIRKAIYGDRRGRKCLHLGPRTEFRPGCRGWNAKHQCKKGLPAVPAVYCQTCEQFDDDGPF